MPLNNSALLNQEIGQFVRIDFENLREWFPTQPVEVQTYVLHWFRCNPSLNRHPRYGPAIYNLQIRNVNHIYYQVYGQFSISDLDEVERMPIEIQERNRNIAWPTTSMPRNDSRPNLIHEDSPFGEWERQHRNIIK